VTPLTDWSGYVNDAPARAQDEERRGTLMGQLEQAERLLFEEGYTFDDPWPGVIYRRDESPPQRVDVEVWVLMRALMRGLGEAGIRREAEPKPRA
jgi:hypothetical protein